LFFVSPSASTRKFAGENQNGNMGFGVARMRRIKQTMVLLGLLSERRNSLFVWSNTIIWSHTFAALRGRAAPRK
jgi:hypothetical protein